MKSRNQASVACVVTRAVGRATGPLIHAALALGVWTSSCTTVVVNGTAPDAATTIDASHDGATEDDASTDADAAALLDANTDAAPDAGPTCVPDGDCCAEGRPFRVGSTCWDNSLPMSAASKCTPQGTCEATVAQTCDVTNVCCDGWGWDPAWHGNACHCVPTNVLDVEYANWRCSDAPGDNQTAAGNGLGYCVHGRCWEKNHQP